MEQLCTTAVGAKLAEATPLISFGLVAPCDLLISGSGAEPGFPCGSVDGDYLPRHLDRLAAALPCGQRRDGGQVRFPGYFR